jgi:large subunit ribosomal protein L10
MAYPKKQELVYLLMIKGRRFVVLGWSYEIVLDTKNSMPNITDGECTLSLNLEEKKAVVAEVGTQLAKAKAIIVAEYRGLEVGQMTQLRIKARQSGVYFRVLKNSLARRVVAGTPFAELSKHMVGPLAYGIGSDPVAAAKVLHEFAKGNDKFVIKAGAMANLVMSDKDIANLATMLSREELLSKLLGTMQAPIVNFVRTLNEVPTKFVRGLAAVRDQK